MTSLLNAADFNLNIFNNYMTDVAVTVLFGLGYYLVKSIRNRGSEREKEMKTVIKNKLEGALERYNYAKTVEEYHQLIKTNYGQTDAYEILNIIVGKGLSPTVDTYNSLLLNSYHNSNFATAKSLRDEILDNSGPVSPNNYTLNILIKGLSLQYKNKNDPKKFDDDLLEIIRSLEIKNIKMDIIAHNTIIDALIDQRRLDEAWAHYEHIKNNLALKFDFYTYTTLLKGIRLTPGVNSMWLNRAFELYDEIKNTSSIVLDESFLNSLLDACVKFGRIDKAEELFNRMRNAGPIKEYSYCIMIKAYSKTFQLEKAFQIFNLLKTTLNCAHPSTVSYGCILNACIRSNQIEKSESIFQEMNALQIEKNAFIYSTMINGYRKIKCFGRAYEIYQSIITSHKDLSVVVFNAMLNCCVDCNNFDKMTEIYNYLKQICLVEENENYDYSDKKSNLQPDIITYSIVMKGYAKANQIPKVMDIYNFVTENKDFHLDEVMYNTLLDSFANNLDEKNFMKIYSDMKKNNVNMSVITLGILIKLYANSSNIYKANELFEEMIRKGLKPSVVIFQLLIKVYARQNKIENAINVFRKMYQCDVKPDYIIYEYIIKICINSGYFEEATEFAQSAMGDGIKVEDSLYCEIIEGTIHSTYFRHNEKKSMLVSLYSKLKSRFYDLPIRLLEKLTKFLYTNNNNNKKNKTENYHSYLENQSIYS